MNETAPAEAPGHASRPQEDKAARVGGGPGQTFWIPGFLIFAFALGVVLGVLVTLQLDWSLHDVPLANQIQASRMGWFLSGASFGLFTGVWLARRKTARIVRAEAA